MQIQPQSQFTVFRQIGDHTDTNRDSYTVVAEIRNAANSQLYKTLVLDSKGSGAYSKNWNVIPNSSPDGTWITVTTRVYTDSAQTTLSTLYQEVSSTYLVKEFANPQPYIPPQIQPEKLDYNKIKSIIEAYDPKIDIPETDLSPLLKNIQEIANELQLINLPDEDLLHAKLDIITSWLEDLSSQMEELKQIIKYH